MENLYQKGDIVYMREGAGKKLDPKYTGPFIVIECLSPSVYKIQGKKNDIGSSSRPVEEI